MFRDRSREGLAMAYNSTVDGVRWVFPDLKTLLAKASPPRSGDALAGIAAQSAIERVAAQMALADLPLKAFLRVDLVPYEDDEVSRLIHDTHDPAAFAAISHLTVGQFREWLLDTRTTTDRLAALAPGVTPEIAAAVSKIMRLQDLVVVAAKCSVVTAFRNTIGLPGRLSTRLQPNHSTDDSRGIAASLLDGLLFGVGDAVIGVNPATDSVQDYVRIVTLLDEIRQRLDIPTQACCLGHVTTAIRAVNLGAPVDLVFQSIAGSEKANRGFGINLSTLVEARDAALSLGRGAVGQNVMYFETGQGSALSATRILASTSRRWKRGLMPSRDTSSPCWSIRLSASSVRNISTMARRSSGLGSRTTFAANCSACRWAAMSAIPTTRKPTRTTWTRC